MYDLIDGELIKRIPTIANMGLDFDFMGPEVKKARELSDKVLTDIKGKLSDRAAALENDFYERHPELD